MKLLLGTALALLAGTLSAQGPRRISEDTDLKLIDLAGWNCEQPGGTAKTPDGVERNQMKNRAPIDLKGRDIPSFDSAAFLQHVSGFDAITKGRRRKDLSPAERTQLEPLEKQIVSLTAYLVIAYAGPPETTNCASVDFHDWHLELFEKPQDHAPGIGDPTPIICEITPRTQNAIFNAGVSIQKLAGFFRRPDLESESTGHPPQRVKITGYLTWDDEHNGAADIGTNITKIAANKYHQPWRASAWEIHPVLKIEPADGAPTMSQTKPVASAAPTQTTTPAPTAAPVVATSAAPQEVTITEPVRVKIPYGEAVLPRGLKLPLVSHNAQTATVKYMNQNYAIPLHSTDLHEP